MYFLINVATKQTAQSFSIVGMHVVPRSISLEDENRFKLSGKSPLQYLTLGLAAAFVVLTLSALVVCVRTKLPRRQ